jgi:hypothetical protein
MSSSQPAYPALFPRNRARDVISRRIFANNADSVADLVLLCRLQCAEGIQAVKVWKTSRRKADGSTEMQSNLSRRKFLGRVGPHHSLVPLNQIVDERYSVYIRNITSTKS